MEHSPDLELLVVVSACLVLWSLFSARLERLSISRRSPFVVLGLLFANPPLSMVHVGIHSSTLLFLSEVTLALLLFSDAAAVRPREDCAGTPACRHGSWRSASP